MSMTNNARTRRTVHLLLIALVVCLGLSIAAVQSPAFAAKTPAKVSGLKVIDVNDFSVIIEWNKAKNAKRYEYQYKKASARKWPKGVDVTYDTYADIELTSSNTKYQIRVRGVNGSKRGKWSSAKTVRTLLQTPYAIWATYIDHSAIELEWYPMTDGKGNKIQEYVLTWDQGDGDIVGEKTVKGTSCRVESLNELNFYCFTVQAVKSGAPTSKPAVVELYTFDQNNKLETESNGALTLRSFSQNDNLFDVLPAMYMINIDSEYNVEEQGFYFPDLELNELKITKGATLNQTSRGDVALTSQTFRVGETFTAPDGSEQKITRLRLTTEPNIVFEDCQYYKDAYDKIEKFIVDIYTEDHPLEGTPFYVEWEH